MGFLLLSGCLYHVREQTDQVALDLARHAFDAAPEAGPAPALAADAGGPTLPPKELPADKAGAAAKAAVRMLPDWDVQTTRYLQAPEGSSLKEILPPRLNIPERIPGAEAPAIQLPEERAKRAAYVRRIYPPLPELPGYPKGDLGPGGKPYTLMDLQRMAVAMSPTVRQAAADVETARGNMIQAGMYPNPNLGWEMDPSNNGETSGVQGFYLEQLIKTAGKLKIAVAANQKLLDNSELALKRARSDLATAVRGAYFGVLVSRETVEVTRALAQFTDEIYRLQANLLAIGFAATYEPAVLRSSANAARLAYRQAVEGYVYNWKQLAAAVGVRDLPLSELSGSLEAHVPRYDYHQALAHVLEHHTDVLTAKNVIEAQRYNLKGAQVVPVPDVDVRFTVQKEVALAPFQWVNTLQFGIVLPIWDQNKGAVLAAEGALARALQEPVRVELNLTNTLAGAFATYRNNLDALESFRKEILPDQVRFYRGVYERRRIDPNAQFGDLVAAQAQLVTSVTTYLTTLGAVWTSVVALADVLQTDDLFQMGQPVELPPLPKMVLPPFVLPGAAQGGPAFPPRAADLPRALPDSPAAARLAAADAADGGPQQAGLPAAPAAAPALPAPALAPLRVVPEDGPPAAAGPTPAPAAGAPASLPPSITGAEGPPLPPPPRIETGTGAEGSKSAAPPATPPPAAFPPRLGTGVLPPVGEDSTTAARPPTPSPPPSQPASVGETK
jgi:cobalt-zinc-cadmium efflux system outer membrane protein